MDGDTITTTVETAHEEATDLEDRLLTLENSGSEILTEVQECKSRLDGLLTRLQETPLTESPTLLQILREVTETRTELANLKAETDSLNRKLSALERPPERLTEEPAPVELLPVEVSEIVEPPPTPTLEPARRKRRIL